MDGPWLPYIPDEPHGENILFLHLNTIDWYVYRESICAKYLLLLDEEGRVMMASEEKSQIVPTGLYTATTDSLPEDFEPNKYFFEGGFTIKSPSEEQIRERNRYRQRKKLAGVSERISLLTTLEISGALSEDDSEMLESLKQYVRALMAVDLLAPQWPEINIGR